MTCMTYVPRTHVLLPIRVVAPYSHVSCGLVGWLAKSAVSVGDPVHRSSPSGPSGPDLTLIGGRPCCHPAVLQIARLVLMF
jgi:hypothetical protein